MFGFAALTLGLMLPHTDSGDLSACGLEPPGPWAAIEPPPRKSPRQGPTATERPFVVRTASGQAYGPGALAGKTIYVSAGHGWVRTSFGWRTQRGNTNLIVEDMVSIEAVNQYLIPYLHAMGAYVVPVREPDLCAQRVIVDDTDALLLGDATEGPAAGRGWGMPTLPITQESVRPFDTADARSLVSTEAGGGELSYALDAPEDGLYNVYISYVQGEDRAPDAHWVVHHSGGETHFRIDQRRHGSTWVLLGRFHFEAGAQAASASVSVLDDSESPGAIVSADAVRIGGGLAVHDRGDGPHPGPMAEQAARYYTQWNGAPESVFDASATDANDDVSSRSRFSAWEHEDGEDAVYVAWHTNAPNPRRGTSSYTYSSSSPPGPLSAFSGVAGSRELQDALHAQLVGDLQAEVDPTWVDDGRSTAFFGEVNPSHNPEMPAVLLEIGYHDTPEDADALRTPDFRRIASRAIAHGIAQYFAERDGVALTLPPEPPKALSLRNDGPGRAVLSWLPPTQPATAGDAPTDYLVQVSPNGYGFDDGTVTGDTSFALEGYEEGDVVFARVVSTNAGGQSLPSSVVGVGLAPSGIGTVVVLDGFDRLDGGLLPVDDFSAYDIGFVDRMRLGEMNDFTYVARHGAAIDGAGYSFDSATDDAIEAGLVEFSDYQAIDWFSGTESSGDEPFSVEQQDALRDAIAAGTDVLVSGAELGWALDNLGTPEEQAFYREQLHAGFSADDADATQITLGGVLSDVGALSFFDPAVYAPQFPDILTAERNAQVAMTYDDARISPAAISWDDGTARGVTMGFPFETIEGAQARTDVMAEVLAYFEVTEADPPEGGTGGTEGDTMPSDSDGGDTGTGGVGTTGGGGSSAGGGETDTDTDGAQADGDGGCGCRSDGGQRPLGAFGLLLLGATAVRRRRPRSHV